MIRAPVAFAVLCAAMLPASGSVAQAPAPAESAPAPADTGNDGLGPAYAYCAALFATLRQEEPAMLDGVPATVDAALRAEADRRTAGWSLGMPLKSAEMHGAADARQLVGKRALVDRLTPRKDEVEVGTEFARCWAIIQPWMKPGGAAKPATR